MEPITEADIVESAQAVNLLKTSRDLDQRMEHLRERGGVASDRQATFIVSVPDDYTDDEVETFKRFVTDTLAGIAKEAQEQVKFERTWAKLGDTE